MSYPDAQVKYVTIPAVHIVVTLCSTSAFRLMVITFILSVHTNLMFLVLQL